MNGIVTMKTGNCFHFRLKKVGPADAGLVFFK